MAMERKQALEACAARLFTEGALKQKLSDAAALSAMPGLDMFPLALPWRITTAKYPRMRGFSENLRFAARDIHAHLMIASLQLPQETRVRIEVDEARLAISREKPRREEE